MKRNIVMLAACTAALTAGMQGTYAEGVTPVYTLDPIVVTATRTPVKKLDTNADIDVVTKKDIELHHDADVGEALKRVPGVMILNNSSNGENYVSNTVYINGSANVVFLIDGMRANTTGNISSNVQLNSFVNMNSIERIEVLKGSASTLYGSDAQGGVINIITKQPKEGEVHTKFSTSFGSADREQYNLYNEGGKDGFFWVVDAQKRIMGDYEDSHGTSVINHINSKALDFKFGKKLGNESSLVFDYMKYKLDYQRPDNGSDDTMRDSGKEDNDRFSLVYKAKISDRLKNQMALYRYHDNLTDDRENNNYGFWSMDLVTTGFSDQLTYQAKDNILTGGFDFYEYDMKHNVGYKSINNKKVTTNAFYLQDIWNIDKHWNLTPGIRIDHHSDFGDHTTPAITLGYKQSRNTNYYLSFKKFFVAPDMYQLYAPGFGNPDLKPAEGQTWELGVNHTFTPTFTVSFNIYKQHANNMVLWSDNTYENVGKSDSRGFSIRLNKAISKHLHANAGYTYTYIDRASSDKNPNYDGFLPKNTINLSLDYSNAKTDAYISGTGMLDRAGRKGYPAISQYKNFWVWNMGADYKVARYAKVFVKADNIFNQFYNENGKSGIPISDSLAAWYSGEGRNYQVGVEFNF